MDAALKNTLTNRKSIEHKYSRMYFRYEPIGTTLYLYSFGNDKFYLSKTRKKPNAASFVKKLQIQKINVGKGNLAGYINTFNLLLGDYYSVQVEIYKLIRSKISLIVFRQYRKRLRFRQFGCRMQD